MTIHPPDRAPTTSPSAAVKTLTARLYRRTDLRGTMLGWRVLLSVASIWLLCGALNLALLQRSGTPPRDRPLIAFGYGPTFLPLGLHRPRSTIAIAGKRIPVRAGAQLLGGGLLLLALLPWLLGGQPSSHRARWQRQARQHAARQGRLPLRAVKQQLRLDGPGLPLARLDDTVLGIPFGTDRNHVGVIAPTGSGKGLHLTETLLRWPGAAVVFDPKGEQWARTAGTRMQWGPVYRLPEHGIDLADFFRLHDPLDVQELHTNLLRAWKDREPIFAEKSLPLIHAAVAYGTATGEHPLQVLARWANRSVLVGLREGHQYAPDRIAQFTDGDDVLGDEGLNKFAQSAWGTLTTRLGPLLPHIDTVTRRDVPPDWVERNATIYICFPLEHVASAGPLMSCITAACIKAVMRQREYTPTLFALDEVHATALARLDTYLATIGGYGGTMLLYLQTISQLDDVYGAAKAQSILGNLHTKVFYPPKDLQTAEYVSKAFGTELRFLRSDSHSAGSAGLGSTSKTRVPHSSQSWSERDVPVLAPAESDALPADAVIVLTQATTYLRVLAQRLNPIPILGELPAPPAIRRARPPRTPRPAAPTAAAAAPPSTPTPAAHRTSPPKPTTDDDDGMY